MMLSHKVFGGMAEEPDYIDMRGYVILYSFIVSASVLI